MTTDDNKSSGVELLVQTIWNLGKIHIQWWILCPRPCSTLLSYVLLLPRNTRCTYLELVSVVHCECLGINSPTDLQQSLMFLARVHLLIDVCQDVVNQFERLCQQLPLLHVRL